MHLKIHIDATLKTPLYRQLVNALVEQIQNGGLKNGAQLPSVRELALELRINPNTVARSYRELENQGFASSHPGKGVFVQFSPDTEDAVLPAELERALQELIETAHRLDVPLDVLPTELRRRSLLRSRQGDST